MLEEALGKRPWLAGESYSIADMVGFNMAGGVWGMVPEAISMDVTPRVMDWLARIYARPAVKQTIGMARLERMVKRYQDLESKTGGAV